MDQTRTKQISSIAPVAGLDFWKALDLFYFPSNLDVSRDE